MYPNYGYPMMSSNAWTPTPFASLTPYVQAMVGPARQQAGASQTGSAFDFLKNIYQGPWDLAQVSQASVPQAAASMYGSYAGGLANILGSYYPSQAAASTAHHAPWASAYEASTGANLARDLEQMKGERQSALLQQLLPTINNLASPGWGQGGFTTNYGAGVS